MVEPPTPVSVLIPVIPCHIYAQTNKTHMPDLEKRKLQLCRKPSMHKILNHDMKKYESCQKADAQGIVESIKIQR